MFIVKNFFYAVGVAFLSGLQSVNPDKGLLRQFVLLLQGDQFWMVVMLGAAILCAVELTCSGPATSTSGAGDLSDLWDRLKTVRLKFIPARLTAADGMNFGPGFAAGTDGKIEFRPPVVRRSGRAASMQHAALLITDRPFEPNERAVAKRMWESCEMFTLDDMSALFLRTDLVCMHELIGMGLYPDVASVDAENTRRLNLRGDKT